MPEDLETQLSTACTAVRRMLIGARTTRSMDAEQTRSYCEQHANRLWASDYPEVAAAYVCKLVIDEKHGLKIVAEART